LFSDPHKTHKCTVWAERRIVECSSKQSCMYADHCTLNVPLYHGWK